MTDAMKRGGALVILTMAGAWLVVVAGREYGVKRATEGTEAAAGPLGNPPMVGDLGPDFTFVETHDADRPEQVTLSKLTADGPVLVVFYLGLQCERCGAQLKGIGDLLPEFQNAGFVVVAISPDSPAATRESLKEYGDIPLLLLSDTDGKVAKAYGLLAGGGEQLHGTFVIGRDGEVKLVETGEQPFTNYPEMLDAGRADTARGK